jgi:hypothetical protein
VVPVSSPRSWSTSFLLIVTPTRRFASAASCSISSLPKGRCERLRDRGDARGSIDLGSGRCDVGQRNHHPAAIAGDFERLHAALGHREEQREFGRNGLAACAEFGTAAADRLHIADVRACGGDGGGKVLPLRPS